MRILAFSPHTDDVELGAGATLARFVEEGASVTVAAFGVGNPDTGATRAEFEASMGVLGITDYVLYDFPARAYPEHRQDILDEMIAFRDQLKPDLVIAPSISDQHQDHVVVATEAGRMSKQSTLLAYEQPWNYVLWTFRPQYFVRVDEEHLERKLQALACYESQQVRPYMAARYIRALAAVRGTQMGQEYAEAFEIVRMVK